MPTASDPLPSPPDCAGAVPDNLAGHPTLYTLDLKGNQLTSLPAKWQESPSDVLATGGPPLNYLSLSGNQLQGGYPAALAAYANLTFLYLQANKLRHAGLPDCM